MTDNPIKIFDEQIVRKPDLYPWTQDFIMAMWEGHWTPEEFNFKSDMHDYKTELNEQEQDIIIKTLTAIAQIETAVKKFWARVGDNLRHPSITDMGLVMANIEVIHTVAYEKLLTVLGLTDKFQEHLKEGVINGRVFYLKKYLEHRYEDDKKQYVYSLILFTLFVENISLFSQFYIVLWFGRYKNVLKDTNQQVLYTKNEETIHGQIGTKLINTIRWEYPELFDDDLKQKILEEAEAAYQSESKIIDWILDGYQNERISPVIVKEYVKYRINESLMGIGYPTIYKIDESLYRDFEWMNEEVLGNVMTDFFFRKDTGYAKNNKTYSEDELFD